MQLHQVPSRIVRGSRGVVFSATGDHYTTLARRAARTLRQAMPRAAIDLFTDQDVDDPVFDQIHQLAESWFRPKIHAIRQTRFEHNILLDADVLVLQDISELFDVLEFCDIAGALARVRTAVMMRPQDGVPRCLPPINSGVLALRASQMMDDFSQAWEGALRETEAPVDQGLLRSLLYNNDIKLLPLGEEYNLIQLALLDNWNPSFGAIRVLHVRSLHQGPPGDPFQPFSVADAIGPERARLVQKMLSTEDQNGAVRIELLDQVGDTPAA